MTILDQPVAKRAQVEIDTDAIWPSLENFFKQAASAAQQMSAGDPSVQSTINPFAQPYLEVLVDGVTYAGSIEEVNNVSKSLAGAVVKISYVADRVYDRYVLVDLEDMGGPFGPRPMPVAQQQRWMSASYYSS